MFLARARKTRRRRKWLTTRVRSGGGKACDLEQGRNPAVRWSDSLGRRVFGFLLCCGILLSFSVDVMLRPKRGNANDSSDEREKDEDANQLAHSSPRFVLFVLMRVRDLA